ncbi:hypothetical protein HY524_00195 [Candidatus Berkelbacteria bacterium]|nr:hypothetical protein [Candidatus Berkelbacteria bacterium]
MNHFREFGLVCIAALILSIPTSGLVVFDESSGFHIEPSFQDLTLQPTDLTGEYDLELVNHTLKPVTYELSVQDLTDLPDLVGRTMPGTVSRDFTDPAYTLSQWVTLSQSAVTLNPGEKTAVTVTVSNDDQLSAGGHYAAIIASGSEVGRSTQETTAVSVQPILDSLLFVRKLGNERYGLIVQALTFKRRFLNIPTSVTIHFRNTGNTHLVPRGRLRIVDPLGRVVSDGVINVSSATLLPSSERAYAVSLNPVNRVWLPGWYRINVDYRHDLETDFHSFQDSVFVSSLVSLSVLTLIAELTVWIVIRRRRA